MVSSERQGLEDKLLAAGALLQAAEAEVRRLRLTGTAQGNDVRASSARAPTGRGHDPAAAPPSSPGQASKTQLDEIVILTRLLWEQEVIATEAVREMNDRCEDAHDMLVQQTRYRRVEAEQLNRRIAWLHAVLKDAMQMLCSERPLSRLRRDGGHRSGIDGLMNRLHEQRLFDGKEYLALNRDVAEARVNPLLHFVLHGLGEDRLDL